MRFLGWFRSKPVVRDSVVWIYLQPLTSLNDVQSEVKKLLGKKYPISWEKVPSNLKNYWDQNCCSRGRMMLICSKDEVGKIENGGLSEKVIYRSTYHSFDSPYRAFKYYSNETDLNDEELAFTEPT